MSDYDKLREVIRATRVAPEHSSKALERIRAILAAASKEPEAQEPLAPTDSTERKAKGGRDRLERGGTDRSE